METDLHLTPTILAQVALMSVANVGLIATFKAQGKLYKPLGDLQDKPWFKAFVLQPLNIVLGVGLCFLMSVGWSVAPKWTDKIVVGVAVGFMSHFIYGLIKQRAAKSGIKLPAADDAAADVATAEDAAQPTTEAPPAANENNQA